MLTNTRTTTYGHINDDRPGGGWAYSLGGRKPESGAIQSQIKAGAYSLIQSKSYNFSYRKKRHRGINNPLAFVTGGRGNTPFSWSTAFGLCSLYKGLRRLA